MDEQVNMFRTQSQIGGQGMNMGSEYDDRFLQDTHINNLDRIAAQKDALNNV